MLLWLTVWPGQCVQIWQQSIIQGQPVFTTSGVSEVSDIRDVQPVRVPNAPIVEPLLRAGPRALRTVCVFRMQDAQQPTVLVADDRVHGRLLCRMVCSAYGLSDSDWQLHRLVESLPSLPTEQYVLSPTSLAWNLVQVPVDLRPLGGRIMLLTSGRCATCGDIAAVAIHDQALGPCPVVLCRTSQGWFHPSARLLLLPHGDAFQVWPMNQAAVSPVAVENSDGRTPTLEDRFSTSLSLPAVGELAYHDLSGANAVVLHSNGHTYTCLPSYADHLSLRSAALHAVAADLRVHARGRLCFARLLPPLDRLPAIQFVAAYCGDEESMCVVDLRPSGGGVYVVQVPRAATPAERIELAVQTHGEPDPEYPLRASLSHFLLHVMHRERVVDPFAPLSAAAPEPLVVTRRRTHVAAGYVDPNFPPEDFGIEPAQEEQESPGGRSGGSRCRANWTFLMLQGLWLSKRLNLLLLPFGFSDSLPLRMMSWLPLLSLVSAVQLPEASGLVSGSLGRPWDVALQVPNLASVTEHATLSRSLHMGAPSAFLGIAIDDTAGMQAYQFCVWSPGDRICFVLDGNAPTVAYRERLLEVKGVLGRGACLLWDPQPYDRCVHLVAISTDRSLVTLIVDTGKEFVCLEVSSKQPGPSILAALLALYPGQHFRIGESVRMPVRNADVVRVHSDAPSVPASPQFLVPQHTFAPIAAESQQHVYILAVDLGLVRLTVPRGASLQLLEHAMLAWLGRQRCLGLRLHQLDLGAALPVFCLPRRGRSTLEVALVDLVDEIMGPLVTAVDDESSDALSCDVLRDPWRPASLYWNDILERGPACVTCWTSRPAMPGDPLVKFAKLGLDVCRALNTGWRSPIPSSVPSYDLVQGASRQGIDWGTSVAAVAGRDVASQTVAAYWPMPASPLFSDALPVPRRALGCSFNSKFGSDGTLFHLECPQMQVRCTVPCTSSRHLWALRLGNWVHAACSEHIGWDEVLEVAGLSYWDLPGTTIHGPTQVWTWPDDLGTLSGQCGHVMHSRSDPHLECMRFDDGVPLAPGRDPPAASSAAARSGHWAGLLAFALTPHWPARILVAASFLAMSSSGDGASSSDESPGLNSTAMPDDVVDDMHPGVADPSRTCTVAWCHELSCQSTHFAVTADALAEYFARYAPTAVVRIHLWLPFQGPVLFDFSKGGETETLATQLQTAGHNPERHALFVAFDTQSTVVDLLSVPPDCIRWWIVRDGISRELLRPVTTWVDEERRAVVTLNSHGQVASLAASPEIASLYNLPQGARGTIASALSRVYGYLQDNTVVLAEASLGVVVAAASCPGRAGAFFLLLLHQVVGGQAMLHDQMILSRSQTAWGSSGSPPRHTRVWTHTLAAPLTVSVHGPT